MKKLPVSFFIYFSLNFIWFFLIIYLMIYYQPESSTYSRFSHFDKLIHFSLFFIQSFLTSKTIYLYKGNFSFNIFIIILLILTVFGSFTEIQQLYIPFRNFDYYDLSVNVIGIFSGLFCVKILSK
mgnify:FL=1